MNDTMGFDLQLCGPVAQNAEQPPRFESAGASKGCAGYGLDRDIHAVTAGRQTIEMKTAVCIPGCDCLFLTGDFISEPEARGLAGEKGNGPSIEEQTARNPEGFIDILLAPVSASRQIRHDLFGRTGIVVNLKLVKHAAEGRPA